MRRFLRLLRALGKGPRPRRAQAWLGLGLAAGAVVWGLVVLFWPLFVIVAMFLLGLLLLGRASRPLPPSS